MPVDEADLHSLDKLPTKLELLKAHMHQIAVLDEREQELVRQHRHTSFSCCSPRLGCRFKLLTPHRVHIEQGTTLTTTLRELRDQLTILETVLQHRQHDEYQRVHAAVSSSASVS
jgi:hypothetical protein